YLAFCGARWATVGHFGLVSFGGYNAVGISGQLLTPEVAAELPPRVQPLAASILEGRRETPGWSNAGGYEEMAENYNVMVWEIAAPAARELYGDEDVLVNRRMSELARRVLLARPSAFVLWLKSAIKHGLVQLFDHGFLEPPGRILLLALAACHVLLLARLRRRPASERGWASPYFEPHAAFLMALVFALAKLSLVVLVEPPIGRYMAPAAIFFPAWLAVLVVERVERLRSA
ncbi:MAG: hypothetical protein KY475_20465, partial [Planctomycetes bacterium]|nr:hypothetical protein [Planctomycetota bacterium]